MLQLTNEKSIPLTDDLREIEDCFHVFRTKLGVDLNPFVFDPMAEEAPDREELEQCGMDEEDIEEMLHSSKNDFHDPAVLKTLFEKLMEYVLGLPKAKETKLLAKELKQLIEGCETAIRAGDKVQLLADFEDREDPDYADEDEDDEN